MQRSLTLVSVQDQVCLSAPALGNNVGPLFASLNSFTSYFKHLGVKSVQAWGRGGRWRKQSVGRLDLGEGGSLLVLAKLNTEKSESADAL